MIQEIPFMDGLPEIDTERLLRAIDNPIKLKAKRSKIKRNLLKLFLKGIGRFAR